MANARDIKIFSGFLIVILNVLFIYTAVKLLEIKGSSKKDKCHKKSLYYSLNYIITQPHIKKRILNTYFP